MHCAQLDCRDSSSVAGFYVLPKFFGVNPHYFVFRDHVEEMVILCLLKSCWTPLLKLLATNFYSFVPLDNTVFPCSLIYFEKEGLLGLLASELVCYETLFKSKNRSVDVQALLTTLDCKCN